MKDAKVAELLPPTKGGVALPANPETPREIMDLLHLAVDKSVPVETMEKLVTLHERVADRRAAQEFFAALAEFQSACPAILKNKETDYTTKAGGRVHYSYATLDQIGTAVRPFLHRLGLSYTWDAKADAGKVTVVCTLRHANGHRETSTFEAAIDRESKMNATQQAGAALTYGKRYSLISVLGLSTAEDDTDGMAGGPTGPVESITDSQAADLEALIEESGADRPKFLAWLGVDDLADVPASRYGAAVKALNAKRGGAPR